MAASRVALALVASLVVGAGVGAGAGAITNLVLPSAQDGRQTEPLFADPADTASDPSAADDPDDPSTWVVDFTGIGPIRMDMMRDQVEALHSGVQLEDFEGYCASYYWGDGTLPWGVMGGLVESQGSYGPIDTVGLYGDPVSDLPRTAAGIGLGSTESAVLAAYPSAEVNQHTYIENGHYVDVYGPGRTTAMRFDTENGVVIGIGVGRVPQVLYVEGCL
jgi:hypothetical protein